MNFQDWWKQLYEDKKKNKSVIIRSTLVIPEKEVKINKDKK